MRKKLLSIGLVALSVGLVNVPVALNKPQPVSAAIHHSYTWWSKKPRKVRVTKDHRIYEIQAVFPRYKSREINSRILKKGSIVKINHGWSYLWIVSGHGLENNYSKKNGRFWVTKGMKGWYSLIK